MIERFSEDIDITFSEHIGESRRKKLKNVVLKGISEELGMPAANWADLAEQFSLSRFPMNLQSLERTYIDKVFALCGYFAADTVPYEAVIGQMRALAASKGL